MPPGIKSPIGGRTFTASSGMRTVDVPDESSWPPSGNDGATSFEDSSVDHFQQQREAEIRAARAARSAGMNGSVSPGARQRIDVLAGIGRVTKGVSVESEAGTVVFSLRTLKNKELKNSIAAAAQVPAVEQVFEARRQQLAYSLFAIDENDIGVVIGSQNFDDKLEFIDELGEHLVGHLYNEYTGLSNEASKRFAIKDQAEMKEVSEDIKK